ncbi:MAG: glycosyltransferase [Candidatus Hinthialibacter antarcticus]|nr:glycosyltransferase [Candidatus Hinthialibacter antarcticus]
MRVLQVIHDFLPNHQAGSELYCYHLSKALQRRGHDVSLFYSEIDHERAAFSTRRGEFDGLPFVEIVNNHSYQSFQETYLNPVVERAFGDYLDEWAPDVVHFHHLHSLSYGCIDACYQRRLPIVFTLHDYWLTCPRGGGQRFRGEGMVCHEVDPSLCAQCVSRYAYSLSGASRWIKRILNRLDHPSDPTLLPKMQRGKINAQQKNFVAPGTLTVGDQAREALFAHPPASIAIRCKTPFASQLLFSIAMDPSTYDQSGAGVLFRIRKNGETIFERSLHAKINSDDRGWHDESLLLEASAKSYTLTFETEAHSSDSNEFCAAAWGEPRLVSTQPQQYAPSLTAQFRAWGESVLGRMQGARLRSQVEARRSKTLALFEQIDLFVAPSPFLRKTFIDYGMPEEKIVFSDYGIADLGYQPAATPPQRPIRFTYVGTLVEHKGVHVLIEAFNRLPRDGAILNVFGSMDEFTGYVKRIQNLIAHPGVRLRGRAENKDVPGILSETDALIVPSIWFENSPITIHEAFLARVPVITSNFGGMADLVQDGKNGLLFDVGDVEALSACLQRCVDDPQLLERLKPNPASVKTLDDDGKWMEEQYQIIQRRKEETPA